jgi:DnaK suppressor protein
MDLAKYKDQLVTLRSELQSMEKTGEQNAQTVTLDQSCVGRLSRMDAMQMQAMSQETNRRRVLKLQRIESALKRIDADDFGYCLRCDQAINLKRLDVDPTVLMCVDCAD